MTVPDQESNNKKRKCPKFCFEKIDEQIVKKLFDFVIKNKDSKILKQDFEKKYQQQAKINKIQLDPYGSSSVSMQSPAIQLGK